MNRRSQSLRSLKRAPWIEWIRNELIFVSQSFYQDSDSLLEQSIYNFILDNSIALSSAKQIVTYVMNNQPKAFPDWYRCDSKRMKVALSLRYRLSYVPGFLINSH